MFVLVSQIMLLYDLRAQNSHWPHVIQSHTNKQGTHDLINPRHPECEEGGGEVTDQETHGSWGSIKVVGDVRARMTNAH